LHNLEKPAVTVLLFESLVAVESNLRQQPVVTKANSSLANLEQQAAGLAARGDQGALPNGLWQSVQSAPPLVPEPTAEGQISAISLNGQNLSASDVRYLNQASQEILQIAGQHSPLQTFEHQVKKVVQLAQQHLTALKTLSSALMERLKIVVDQVLEIRDPNESAALGTEGEQLERIPNEDIAVEGVQVAAAHPLLVEDSGLEDGGAQIRTDPIVEPAVSDRALLSGLAQAGTMRGTAGIGGDGQLALVTDQLSANLQTDSEETPESVVQSKPSAKSAGGETGELAVFAPETTGTLDRALEQFLSRIDDLGQDLVQALGPSGLVSWWTVAAVVGVAAAATRRQRRRRGQSPVGLAAAGEGSVTWLSGLPGPFNSAED
jgi:hypothetical protein